MFCFEIKLAIGQLRPRGWESWVLLELTKGRDQLEVSLRIITLAHHSRGTQSLRRSLTGVAARISFTGPEEARNS